VPTRPSAGPEPTSPINPGTGWQVGFALDTCSSRPLVGRTDFDPKRTLSGSVQKAIGETFALHDLEWPEYGQLALRGFLRRASTLEVVNGEQSI
jgi:hypothetical protein